MPRRHLYAFARFVAFGILLAPPAANAGEVLDQFWPETDIFVKTSPNTRLFFLFSGTRTRAGGYTDGQIGGHVDFFVSPFFKTRLNRHPDVARNKFLQIRAGYLFGQTPKDSTDPFTEHTPTLEITPRYYFPRGILVTARTRADFRFVDGDFTPRYRLRVKMERTLPLRGVSWTPYAYTEAFYDPRYDSFHRFRFAGGAEVEIKRWLVLEAYFLRQQDSRATPHGMNVGGLAVQFYLR